MTSLVTGHMLMTSTADHDLKWAEEVRATFTGNVSAYIKA